MNLTQLLTEAVNHHQAGRLAEAEKRYQQILAKQPRHPDALHLLGVIAHQTGRNEIAIGFIRRAIVLHPRGAEYHNTLGQALQQLGQGAAAIAALQRAVQLKPDYAEAHSNLGSALQARGELPAAIACYETAIKCRPDLAAAFNNLASALREAGRLSEARVAAQNALRLNQRLADAHANYANVLKDCGELDEAIAHYREAVRLNPLDSSIHSDLLLTLHYHPDYDARRLADEHGVWAQRHANRLQSPIEAHANEPVAGRRLRIGYVSPDFRSHSAARFIRPLLRQHDATSFEIFCYSDVVRDDSTTRILRGLVPNWRDIAGLPDATVASQVRNDRIDILVDLAAHSARNRILLFARKPAPIQITYLAYAGSTGLGAIDYRFTDRFLDPPGFNRSVYTEQSIELPETYWCCDPPDAMIEPQTAPLPSRGPITFGCLNNLCKVNPRVLALWAELLRMSPGSQLILHAPEGNHREVVRQRLGANGAAHDRISFVPAQGLADYFATYHRIDIALDPFPFTGGTTTCDALWMGVPVVTLKGQTAVGRGGVSLLSNVGLPELVAENEGDYVRIALDLASDRVRLASLRASLRARLQASSVMDAPRFARHIELTYRRLWTDWCRLRST